MAPSEESSCPLSKSKVPLHLQTFHRSSLTTEPPSTRSPYPYTVTPLHSPKVDTDTARAETVELCPPHWRLPSKPQPLRNRLKGILLKDLQSYNITSSKTSRKRTSPEHSRPAAMRMKDSDDYITARAANPRTGLISPSVGSPSSPRQLPGTPGSPGEALKKASHYQQEYGDSDSPTLDIKARPALKRDDAETVRKISSRMQHATGQAWFVDEIGWLKNSNMAATVEPEVTTVDAGARVYRKGSLHDRRGDDVLTVRMPSAREPQPYAYPGYSAQQIEALQRCTEKRRRVVSAERYDAQANASCVANKQGYHRRAPHLHNNPHCLSGAEVDGVIFAPFSSPRTPSSSKDPVSTAMKTLERPITQDSHPPGHSIPRKPLLTTTTKPSASERPGHDIRTLPRVRLIHPSLAAYPPNQASSRQCSLGCTRDSGTDLCVQRRLASSGSATSKTKRSLFNVDTGQTGLDGYTSGLRDESEAVFVTQRMWCISPTDIIVGLLITLTNTIKLIRLPTSLPQFLNLPLEILTAEDASPQRKAQALKEVLSTVGQALLLVTLTAMVWQVGSTVMRCLCVIFWPLGALGRVVRWLLFGT